MNRKKRADDLTFTYPIMMNEQSPETVGQWLDILGLPRNTMKEYFKNKLVFINDHIVNPKSGCEEGDILRIAIRKEQIDVEPVAMDLVILYEDEDVLVIDKPSGMTVNSKGQVSIANGIAYYFKEHNIYRKVRFLNRLDRDTSGCIVIAKHGIAQSMYQQQMELDNFEKWYEAEVRGELKNPIGTIEVPMGLDADGIHRRVDVSGKMTKTVYRVLSYNSKTDISRVEIRLMTGKTHQIRVAMAHIGHPLVDDPLYDTSYTSVHEEAGRTFSLRAKRIVFHHMRTHEQIKVTA